VSLLQVGQEKASRDQVRSGEALISSLICRW
jgi:hypothetical protein